MSSIFSDDEYSDFNQSDDSDIEISQNSLSDEKISNFDDLTHVDYKIRSHFEGNYENEQNAIRALQIQLQKLEDFREEAIHDLKLKINLTIRKIEQTQQSRIIEDEHTRFQISRMKPQSYETDEDESAKPSSIQKQDPRDELSKTNQKIKEIKEAMNDSINSHNQRKSKLEAAITEIKDQIKEFEEKENEAWKKNGEIFRERDLLTEKLESKKYELELAKERLERAKQDLADLKGEIVELDE